MHLTKKKNINNQLMNISKVESIYIKKLVEVIKSKYSSNVSCQIH